MTYKLYYMGYNNQKMYIDGMKFSDEETARRWALIWEIISSFGMIYVEEEK